MSFGPSNSTIYSSGSDSGVGCDLAAPIGGGSLVRRLSMPRLDRRKPTVVLCWLRAVCILLRASAFSSISNLRVVVLERPAGGDGSCVLVVDSDRRLRGVDITISESRHVTWGAERHLGVFIKERRTVAYIRDWSFLLRTPKQYNFISQRIIAAVVVRTLHRLYTIVLVSMRDLNVAI